MRKLITVASVNIIMFICMIGIAHATPSTTYWTPMTLDIQSYGVTHIGVDNYFSVGNKTSDEPAINNSFATDIGLTVGVLPFEKLQMEIGVDYLSHQTIRSILTPRSVHLKMLCLNGFRLCK